MKLVVDANIVMAALIRDSEARRIISSGELEFVSPDFVLEEVYKYEDYICVKSGLAKEEFELLLALVFERISIIPFSEYSACNDAAAAIMVNDPKDMPYVACFLALKCDGIWTNDPDYDGKEGVKVINTGDLLALL